MISRIRPFLSKKEENNELQEGFYTDVGISSKRIKSIILGRCGATLKEIINVARYFNIPSSMLIVRANKYPTITKQCGHCLADYIPGNARAIYCSDACRNKAHRAK